MSRERETKIEKTGSDPDDQDVPRACGEQRYQSFAEFHSGYTTNYINLADSKATWMFTVVSAAILYYVSAEEFRSSLLSEISFTSYIFLLLPVIFLIVSAGSSFFVIFPRLGSSGEQILFFGSVANKANAETYAKEILSKNEHDLIRVHLMHCYDLSVVCRAKYQNLQRAMWSGAIGVAFLALNFVFLWPLTSSS